LLGTFPGTAKFAVRLEPTHCAMLSVRKVLNHPQVLSTNRHLLQGWVELADVTWDGTAGRLSGVAKVSGGEPFRIVLAGNGREPHQVTAQDARARIEQHPAKGLTRVVLERDQNGPVKWQVDWTKAK
jgi:hypothetical protein